MKNRIKLIMLLIVICILTIGKPVKAQSAYETALNNARSENNTCVYVDNANNIFGYKVESGKANYKFYLYKGNASTISFSDKDGNVSASGYNISKSNCRPYVSACLDDGNYKFVYESAVAGSANIQCNSGKIVFILDQPGNTQGGALDEANNGNYKCVYRDDGNNVAVTNLDKSLGLISIKFLRKDGVGSNMTVNVGAPSDLSNCPSYFLYARQSDEGSFGGTGNNSAYSRLGNDFNELCNLAKNKDSIAYDVLTLEGVNVDSVCSSSTSDQGEISGEPTPDIGYSDMDCYGLLGMPYDSNSPAYWLQLALKIMRYVGIAALVVLSTIDFIQAITKQDSDALKKAINKSVRRFIFAVLLFFVPLLTQIIMDFFGVYGTCTL